MKCMKVCRVLAVFLVSLLVAGLCLSGVAAAQPPTFFVVVPVTQAVFQGESFTVDLLVTPVNTSIVSAQCNVAFDPAFLTAESVTEGNLFTQGCASTNFSGGMIDNTAGTITGISCAPTAPPGCAVSTQGVLATIHFRAKNKVGPSDIDLYGVIVRDPTGNPVRLEVGGGQVTVMGPPPVPATSLWGAVGLAAVLAALVAWSVRRRLAARNGVR